jgi:hypothetical protein
MIDFHRSTFLWKSKPWVADEFYRYPGGFVGTPGQVYHVRFKLDAMCTIESESSAEGRQKTEIFIGAPCRTEYTIATRNLFQIPSAEFRLAFSRNWRLAIAARPSNEQEPTTVARLEDAFQEHRINVREFDQSEKLTTTQEIAEATLADHILNGRSTYRDEARGLRVTVEYPVNLINVNAADNEFQVCTGPVILPDLATWDGQEVRRVFLAHVAFTAFDHVEFILRREVEAAPAEREWLDQPRGRDRLALIDPNRQPPNYPPLRPRPTTYNETWELPAENTVIAAKFET